MPTSGNPWRPTCPGKSGEAVGGPGRTWDSKEQFDKQILMKSPLSLEERSSFGSLSGPG